MCVRAGVYIESVGGAKETITGRVSAHFQLRPTYYGVYIISPFSAACCRPDVPL